MQTKGGGKHDILSVGRATATTLNCLWMMPRDPYADMCPGTQTASVSTEECMAHQSCVSPADHDGERSNPGAGTRAIAGLCMIKQWRSAWRGSSGTTAQLGGQDKSRSLRPGWPAADGRKISDLLRCALPHDSLHFEKSQTPSKRRAPRVTRTR